MPRTLLPLASSGGEKMPMPATPGHDGADAAADAALGGNADAIGPLAGVVVHAAGEHDAEHVLDVLLLDGPLLVIGIDAAVGQRGAHHGQVVAR